MSNGWVTGWKEISKFCGLSKDCVVKNFKKWNLPVRKLPNGKPAAIPSELDQWLKDQPVR